MGGQYTYLASLFIFGVLLGVTGLLAAERERRARSHSRGSSSPAQ